MTRLYVHISVENLAESIRFYSALFASEPTVMKPDYAKWMLDDPRVNFAISRRGSKFGVDHLGVQVESEEELSEMKARLSAADLPMDEQVGTNCCHAKSDKYWTIAPQGIAWESYHTLDAIPTFGESRTEPTASACCAPAPTTITFRSRNQ